MKRTITFLLCLFCWLAGFSPSAVAEDFLGAKILPGARIVTKTKKQLVMRTSLSHDQALEFYKDALKEGKDIKYRSWKDQTYIEDDGVLPWHSITIEKNAGQEGTQIVIKRDNWTWMLGTLTLRFIGVFAVLLVLYLGMSISGGIISRSLKRMEGGGKTLSPQPSGDKKTPEPA